MKIFNSSLVQSLNCSFLKHQQIDILRDDLIHPTVSGNKWRKLKYIVQHILDNKIEHVVTFGGAYSNHLVAVAFVCNYLGIKSTAFVRGNEIRNQNHYEKLCVENNMQLLHVSREDYRDKHKLYNMHFSQFENSVMLDEGGNHPLALKGCEEIFDELQNKYNYIVLSLGTGTTMEGLVKGVNDRKLKTKIIGISALKNNFELDGRLAKYPKNTWEVLHQYHRGKYGKIDNGLLSFIAAFYFETNIKIEPIYTAKMLLAVKDLIETNFFKPTDKILVIHTGGLLAFPQ